MVLVTNLNHFVKQIYFLLDFKRSWSWNNYVLLIDLNTKSSNVRYLWDLRIHEKCNQNHRMQKKKKIYNFRAATLVKSWQRAPITLELSENEFFRFRKFQKRVKLSKPAKLSKRAKL